MTRAETLLARALAAVVRFPSPIVEVWFALYLAGWGALCFAEPAMFEAMPVAYGRLTGPGTGLDHEWQYGLLFVAVGAVQFVAARPALGDAPEHRASGRRLVVAVVAACVLGGLASAFVVGGTATSGTYTYGYLALSQVAVSARLVMVRWGRARGLVVRGRYLVTAEHERPPRPRP